MNNNKDQEQKPKEQLNTYARFTGIGFQMLVTIGLGAYVGVKLDEHYPNQYSAYTIICSLFFIAIALYSVIKQVTNFTNKKDKQNDKRNH